MTRFLFELHRSQKKEDQAIGLRCASFMVKGEIDATSINAVKDSAIRMMVLPGVWDLMVRNAEPGCEWKDAGRFDTRAPDQVPPVPKTALKARTSHTGARRS
jgi:hypothetical protein